MRDRHRNANLARLIAFKIVIQKSEDDLRPSDQQAEAKPHKVLDCEGFEQMGFQKALEDAALGRQQWRRNASTG